MSNLDNLLQEKAAIENRIKEAKKAKRAEAIAQCQKLIKEFELTQAQVFKGIRRKGGTTRTVAAKYRDPQTGATWTGRGKAPKWIEGKNRDNFLIR